MSGSMQPRNMNQQRLSVVVAEKSVITRRDHWSPVMQQNYCVEKCIEPQRPS